MNGGGGARASSALWGSVAAAACARSGGGCRARRSSGCWSCSPTGWWRWAPPPPCSSASSPCPTAGTPPAASAGCCPPASPGRCRSCLPSSSRWGSPPAGGLPPAPGPTGCCWAASSCTTRTGKPTPFFTFVLALLFCVYNGYLQGRSLSNYAKYPSGWLKDPLFITGFIGWLVGMAINIHSDHILRNLRKPGETGYKIPRGGMFEYVSGANFFGEILEWFGFALACCTIESLAFALCTLFILGSRAKQHHQWYLEKFEDYPKCRKIVIPFVY
ncbi:3-oxo-5-alpha-steroid 4-dehydrogenase 1 isoform X1 [Larus michahellis]|uniref:3-oxo-5-alpha-steroid 4-dehydrogenase 1 isoform X1 n=1 Tax=Larus michahellis TaxID=119627 RepID=UPI003D9ACBEE